MKINKLFLNIMLAAGAASLVACNGGTSSSNASGMNELQEYVSQLSYSPKYSKQLSGVNSNQQSFSLNSAAELANIQIAYYQESNCTSLNNTVTLNGPASMAAGTYTSSNASNFSLCGRYPDGCVGLLTAVQNAPAWSMQYTYNFTNGSSYQSVCMNNPTNPVGKAAEFMANYSSGVAACTAGNSCGFSQAYSILPMGWVDQVGASNGISYGAGVTTDSSGNLIITGNTNVGLSGQPLTGTQDYFIAKYDNSGSLLWSRQGGTNIAVYGVGTDESSNSYIGGYTYAALPGQTQTGVKDYFIAKYDSSGNLVWNRQVGVAGSYTPGYGITADKYGNSYLIGTAIAGLSGQTQTGLEDYFIVKYNSDGNLIWTRQVGSAGGKTRGLAITSDSVGNIYATGYTTAGLSGQTQTGTRDYYIVKYDSSGNLIWTRQVGSVGGTTTGTSLSFDSSNVYVSGNTNVGLSGQTQTGTQDCFIAKYDTDGSLIWTRQIGANNTPGYGFIVNNSGNSCVTSYTAQFPPVGNKDYFIVKYDSDGNLIWNKQLGSTGSTTAGTSLSLHSGNVYITGYTTAGVFGQSQTGTLDYIVAKVPNQN